MKFAIISAGEGSRLSQEGVALPKPLVQLNGVAMIDRLIQIFVRNGADKVVVIINNESPLTKEHLAKLQAEAEIPLEVVVKTMLTRAGKIREKDEKIHMILTSENQENIQETFDLMPAVYLITPLEKESLRHWIQTIQKRVKDRRLYITFNYKRKTYHIPYREILYLESQQHKIRVVTAKESYTFYGQLSRIQKQMQQGRETFLRIHQSYLVNSRYVYWMDRNTVRTQDGRRFSVSSSYREQAREKYLGYVKQI